jgi:hypothetical protein
VDLLDLVEHQEGSLTFCPGLESGEVPLLFQPGPIAQGRFIRRRVVGRESGVAHHLSDHGGLSDLPRACNHLEKPASLAEPFQEFGVDGLADHTNYSID